MLWLCLVALIDRTRHARRKGWPLEEVTLRLRHSKIYACDCAECDTKEGKIDRIERDIQFVGALRDFVADKEIATLNVAGVLRKK